MRITVLFSLVASLVFDRANAKEYVLITGGLGYIGSHTTVELVKTLKENVLIMDNLDNSKMIALDRVK